MCVIIKSYNANYCILWFWLIFLFKSLNLSLSFSFTMICKSHMHVYRYMYLYKFMSLEFMQSALITCPFVLHYKLHFVQLLQSCFFYLHIKMLLLLERFRRFQACMNFRAEHLLSYNTSAHVHILGLVEGSKNVFTPGYKCIKWKTAKYKLVSCTCTINLYHVLVHVCNFKFWGYAASVKAQVVPYIVKAISYH